MSNSSVSNVPEFRESRRRPHAAVSIRSCSGRAGRLTVACILDEFSYNSFSPEADFMPLTMRDWRAEITATQPDLLLVESAWRGHRDSWWNTVSQCGPEIRSLLQWCSERGIPTAFWNKEDPVHFGTFLSLSSLFDVVFTTDLDCVPRYKAKLAHDRVFFLPFAAQPTVHNPVEVFERVAGCAFAGAYYAKYPQRNEALDDLSDILASEGCFDIYDRNFSNPHPDHTFPERFRDRIVGGLNPDEIDVAYKGYTTNLNLNSVQESQSMFARRVFELLASNTSVVSNFARGLRLMFGDLVLTVSGADELARRKRELDFIPNGTERLRHQGLRKVMSEHTYSERLAYIAEKCGLPLEPADSVIPVILAEAASETSLKTLTRSAQSQTLASWRLVIWGSAVVDSTSSDERITFASTRDEAFSLIHGLNATHIGIWNAKDWYGPDYLADLATTLRWADVAGAGHTERWVNRSGALVRADFGSAWTMNESIDLARGIVQVDAVSDARAEMRFQGLAVAPVEYCEGGAALGESALAPASRIVLDEGLSLNELRAYADDLSADLEHQESDDDVLLNEMLVGINSHGAVTVNRNDDGSIEVVSELPSGSHQYVYSSETVDLRYLPDGESPTGYFATGPGVNVQLVFVYLGADGDKLAHTIVPNAKNTSFVIPVGTQAVRMGLRVAGTGKSCLERFSRAPKQTVPHPLLFKSENLLVTNIYPSYKQLYRNGFVASRVRAYAGEGLNVDVALVSEKLDSSSFREFGNVDVATMSAPTLASSLESGRVRRVLTHFLDRPIRDVLLDARGLDSVTIWIHGFEVQPWHRRAFQYTTDYGLAAAKASSKSKMAMWQELFTDPPANWHFVFVSQYLAEQSFEDTGVRLPEELYSVVHNPIDTIQFGYREKNLDDRFRVLSVRPYASNVYANDLAVAAVLRLQQQRRDFNKFTFAFYGDGPLFEAITSPLREVENVQLHQTFLTQDEIAALHQDFGVFLTPSRMDTQGVSRGEAMSSGLVPVASDVAAVPEFVDEESGLLAPPEDVEALADAMSRLADDPDLFLRLSRGATERVKQQAGRDVVIEQELRIIYRR